MKADKMTIIKLKTLKFQNNITKNPQSSQEERQIPLLLACETPYKKIEDPKMIRSKLKTQLKTTTCAQVRAMATVQGGQGSRQTRILARNRTFRRRHSDLPTLLYLKALGPERPMRGIMEHARGWCK
jgi:hypothetical protein